MKAPTVFLVLTGVLSHVSTSAQERGAQGAGSETDFSGVYAVGVFGGDLGPTTVERPEVYPFTLEGERAQNAYDPLVSDIRQADDCAKDPMPEILWSGNPIEIIQEDERIMIRYEDADTVRSIAMNGPPLGWPDQGRAPLGYSAGRWEGEVLIIETTHMTAVAIFSNRGYPLSPEARVTERYARQPGNHLQLEIEVNDPVNYTETFTLRRMMMWAPDEQVRPWECVSLGHREISDIDELARMLEEL